MTGRVRLDPRHYRVDDLLRRPFTAETPMVCRGSVLRADAPSGWGWSGDVWLGEERAALFDLRIRVDGIPLPPAEAIFRPSHVTVFGHDPETGVQVVEDKFLAEDDVAVSVLSFRNPADGSVGLAVEPRWKIGAGDVTVAGRRYALHRAGPPGDDLAGQAPSNWRGTMVFAVALGDDPEDARSRAEAWRERPGPVARQVENFHAAFEAAFGRFDCADPWLMRLWYHGACARWRRSLRFALDDGSGPELSVRDAFAGGDFDRPRPQAERWPAWIARHVVGLHVELGELVARLDPVRAGAHLCLEDLPVEGRRVRVVWDDPAAPDDAYHDGQKGLEVVVVAEEGL